MSRLSPAARVCLAASAALAAACGGARAARSGTDASAAPAPAAPSTVPDWPEGPTAPSRAGTWGLGATACPAPSAAPRDSSAPRDTASRPDSAAGRAGAGTTDGRADIVILAAATVREIRFNAQPDVRVRLCGGLDSVHVVERRNLPEHVVSGTTYRDVFVAVEILGHVNVGCADSSAAARSAQLRAGTTCLRFSLSDSAGARRRPP